MDYLYVYEWLYKYTFILQNTYIKNISLNNLNNDIYLSIMYLYFFIKFLIDNIIKETSVFNSEHQINYISNVFLNQKTIDFNI